MESPPNQAAWLSASSKRPLEVQSAPYTSPAANELVVKNAAIAVNPMEWSKQVMGNYIFEWIRCPFVMGNDLAGQVVEVGEEVTGFKLGDRVLAHAISMDPTINKSSEGAFQEYTVVRANLTSPIPDSLSYEEACVLPLGLSTAATALFQTDFLALDYPTATSKAAKSTVKTVIIWGGSTSVGSNAIQLATAAGYDVITTASPKNFEYVKGLGATNVFDYNSKSTVEDIIHVLRTKKPVGAIAIGNNSTEACMDILAKTDGSKFVAQISFPFPEKAPVTAWQLFLFMMGLMWWNITIYFKSVRRGVVTKFVFGSSLVHNEVGAMIYNRFLPNALENGEYRVVPKPVIIGKGLEQIQAALDVHMKGVSAQKVVVSL
jgi:NADPH:quinone reductase-like Zn-dependent oxidoreductase